jgi:CRISPR-associated protein (TIGR02584 family)
MTTQSPESYPRRILLCVTGLSPQVVTETLYALSVKAASPITPTEVHLITTRPGAEHAKLNLLSREPGWFHRFCRDYGLENIRFDQSSIHTLTDDQGQPLEDIRSLEDNEATANQITDIVRNLTREPDTALLVSLAGGRKTMGFYLGYALSLFGRPQDRLSHVLVSAPFESHPLFYYPTPYESVIHTNDRVQLTLDCRKAEVTLADIPFVSLRHGLPPDVLRGEASYFKVVAAAQTHLGPPSIQINLAARSMVAGGKSIALTPVELAWYAWMARRQSEGKPPLAIPADGEFNESYGQAYLAEYRIIARLKNDEDRTTEALRRGMDKTFFETHKSRINKKLKQALSGQAEPYLIQPSGRRPRTCFGLQLAAESIEIRNDH